jgi:hypothetical protein
MTSNQMCATTHVLCHEDAFGMSLYSIEYKLTIRFLKEPFQQNTSNKASVCMWSLSVFYNQNCVFFYFVHAACFLHTNTYRFNFSNSARRRLHLHIVVQFCAFLRYFFHLV